MNNPSRRRAASARRLHSLMLAASALAATVPASRLAAQEAPPATPAPAPDAATVPTDIVVLAPVVVTATRTPVGAAELGSAVDVVSGAEIARRQLDSLTAVLAGAGVAPVQTGAAGGVTSVFLRGANSNQTVFLVDGIRINDANTSYFNFLGGGAPSRFDELVIVRGPQSTLYGADAMGGVIALGSRRGAGAPSATVSAEAGSFGTVQGRVSAEGERGPWAYTASVLSGRTDNARSDNAYERTSVSTRVDRTINERVSVGATVRGLLTDFESPSDRYTNDPNDREREQRWLGTVFAELAPAEDWTARVTLGAQHRRQVSENPPPNPEFFPMGDSIVENSRFVLDAQTSYTGVADHRVTVGATAENTRVRGTFSPEDHGDLWAVFAQDEWTPTERLSLTAGVRHDEFDTFGGHTTGRGTVAYHVVPDRLKARASYGTSFRAPGALELTGAFGNPDLDPERARGGDVGLDVYFSRSCTVFSVTAFRTDYKDLIEYPPPFVPVNVGEATTRGVEIGLRTALESGLRASLSYTYLDASNDATGERLLRRPRHAAGFDIAQDLGKTITIGGGATLYADAADIDALTFARIDAEDYVVARLYASWAATERLTLKARVENLFDTDYEAVNGYPSLGIGAFVGAEYRF